MSRVGITAMTRSSPPHSSRGRKGRRWDGGERKYRGIAWKDNFDYFQDFFLFIWIFNFLCRLTLPPLPLASSLCWNSSTTKILTWWSKREKGRKTVCVCVFILVWFDGGTQKRDNLILRQLFWRCFFRSFLSILGNISARTSTAHRHQVRNFFPLPQNIFKMRDNSND